MLDLHLRFCWDIVDDIHSSRRYGIFDLLDSNGQIMPVMGGVYILGTSDGTTLTYPKGNSPIYFIGHEGNLAHTLRHLKNQIEVQRNENCYGGSTSCYYASTFGAHCVFFTKMKGKNPVEVAKDLKRSFFNLFGADPIA